MGTGTAMDAGNTNIDIPCKGLNVNLILFSLRMFCAI